MTMSSKPAPSVSSSTSAWKSSVPTPLRTTVPAEVRPTSSATEAGTSVITIVAGASSPEEKRYSRSSPGRPMIHMVPPALGSRRRRWV